MFTSLWITFPIRSLQESGPPLSLLVIKSGRRQSGRMTHKMAPVTRGISCAFCRPNFVWTHYGLCHILIFPSTLASLSFLIPSVQAQVLFTQLPKPFSARSQSKTSLKEGFRIKKQTLYRRKPATPPAALNWLCLKAVFPIHNYQPHSYRCASEIHDYFRSQRWGSWLAL